jgi:DNA-binding SARP family transcriptional activator
MITCRTFGPVEVRVDSQAAPAELLWRKNLALLLYLARSPHRRRSRQHLIGLLWADKDEKAARHSLTEALRVLRQIVGEDKLAAQGDTIELASDAIDLDIDHFERAMERGDVVGASDMVTGDFLEGFAIGDASEFEDWLTAERSTLRRQGVEVLVRHANQLSSSGQVSTATQIAERAAALDPWSEVALRAVMRCLCLSGNRAAALEQYDVLTTRLTKEFQSQPEQATVQLAERIRQDRLLGLASSATQSDAAKDLAESRRAPLVGRERELGSIIESWTACRSNTEAHAAVILGDSGTGKTRLVEEVLDRARLDGAAVVGLRAVEADLSLPWSGVYGLARGGLLDIPGVAGSPPAALASFTQELPEWQDHYAEAVKGVAAAPVGHAIGEVLRAALEEQPIAVMIDDAHWLDHESFAAVLAVLRDLASMPLFLVFTATQLHQRDELDDLRSRLSRDVAGVSVTLGPLSADALAELVRWAIPSYSTEETERLTRRLGVDSAGYPLLAVELLHAVASGFDLDSAAGAWPSPLHTLSETVPGDLPDTIVAAIRVGFNRLSPDAQQVLAAAAVLGVRPAAETLAIGTGLPGEQVHTALDQLEWQRWLSFESRGYVFVARIVRDIIARDMITPGARERVVEAVKR